MKKYFIGLIIVNLMLCTMALIYGDYKKSFTCQICEAQTTEPVIVQIDAGHKVYKENGKCYIDIWEYTLCQDCYDELMPILFKEIKRMRKEANAKKDSQ